ncbi:MAG: LPS export ABC transporter ATP-binding protein [Deltaproteobacteria bacterium]|nr:LPS export ABC transporter ATP-binding protein [Deltaproteobacteria bacterium]
MTRVLRVSNISKSYKRTKVLHNISIDVNRGEAVGLLGPNGAGKTTLFKIIAGLLKYNRGDVFYCDDNSKIPCINMSNFPLYKRARIGVGYLGQEPAIFEGLSVKDNLLAVLHLLKRKGDYNLAQELLDRFNLAKVSQNPASTLSGGEKRKLEFARVLLTNPGLLLVDEPFAGVDPIAASEISNIIRELAGDGIGVLLTDHSVSQALYSCDRIYLIVDGKIAEEGTSDNILNSSNARNLYLGNSVSSQLL